MGFSGGGLAALPESCSISWVVAAGIAASRGGDGDFRFGELLAAAGSSRVALALKGKVSRGQHEYKKVKR